MRANNLTPDVIAVWSDIGCPWSTLTPHTLHERAADRGIALWIDHRAFPLQLINAPIPKPAQDSEMTETTAICRHFGRGDVNHFQHYDSSWTDDLLERMRYRRCKHSRHDS